MRILHTADWHIGKMLHKESLQEEMGFFLQWLTSILEHRDVDVLLISGDIFDVANPAVKDRETYYHFLAGLLGKNVRVVITGGNHDSIGMLDAPQDILKAMNIDVVGGATENIEDEIICIEQNGETSLVIAAVPFLRDKNLRNLNSAEKFESREEALKEGIRRHYHELGNICDSKYASIPSIAMGHLYARGVSTSDSEREIHIGNAAAVDSDVFSSSFDYVALGHIHRPQIVGGSQMIRYSGSPIPLSFSEKSDLKSIVLLEIENNQFKTPEIIPVPKSRELKKFKGSFQDVAKMLSEYNPEFPLISFVEIEVIEEVFSSIVLSNVDELVNQFSTHEKIRILKSRTLFDVGAKDTSELFHSGKNIEDLSPIDVFKKRIEGEELDEEKRKILTDTFHELLEGIND